MLNDHLIADLAERVQNRFYGKYRGVVTQVDEDTVRVKAKVPAAHVSVADLEGAYSVADLVNRQTGEVLLEANKPLTAEIWTGSPSKIRSRAVWSSVWALTERILVRLGSVAGLAIFLG